MAEHHRSRPCRQCHRVIHLEHLGDLGRLHLAAAGRSRKSPSCPASHPVDEAHANEVWGHVEAVGAANGGHVRETDG